MSETNQPELTILMPCLNEAETLATCIQKAQSFLSEKMVIGEILIADNGSADGSRDIARENGARVVDIPQRGYGAALIGGCNAANGKYVIMGDADDSYDFTNLMPLLEKLRDGVDLVMGNRFKGGIEKGAMPPLHRYLGNPVLSGIGRLFFNCSEIGDFHCGLRGYNTERMRALDLKTTGMEYASEMVVQAVINDYTVTEVPATLSKDGRTRAPHLRSWHDGWRHLKFLLLHSPNWLFLYPGFFLVIIGLLFGTAIEIVPIHAFGVVFDVNSLLFCSAMVIWGYNLILFHTYTRVYAMQARFIKAKKTPLTEINADVCIVFGLCLTVVGIVLSIISIVSWGQKSFGDMNPQELLRITIPSVTLILIGIQTAFSGFFVDILKIRIKNDNVK